VGYLKLQHYMAAKQTGQLLNMRGEVLTVTIRMGQTEM
jgi:hypothetical protein